MQSVQEGDINTHSVHTHGKYFKEPDLECVQFKP